MKSTNEELGHRFASDRAWLIGLRVDRFRLLTSLTPVCALICVISLVAIAVRASDATGDGSSTAVEHTPAVPSIAFPGKSWESKRPEALGLERDRLDELAKVLGGRGCVVKDGYIVKAWGSQSDAPGLVLVGQARAQHAADVRAPGGEGQERRPADPRLRLGSSSRKDRTMTFRQLANMTSGYARPETPGEAWSYNDFAIQLYQKTLFDRVYPRGPRGRRQ